MMPIASPSRVELSEPLALLRWLESDPVSVSLGAIDPIELWGLVALAARARTDGEAPLRVNLEQASRSCQFARAVGFEDVLSGAGGLASAAAERGRTVKLARIQRHASTEPPSDQISRLLVADPALEDTRRTLYYVLNELLRNVVQHSQDRLGGIVGAQLNRGGRNSDLPMVQVAVVDAGIGIPVSLQSRHTSLADAGAALEKSLWPHISSTFDEGETGSAQNAGMGLFFISEMTKLVGGRLVIATRGATLTLQGDENFEDPHGIQKVHKGVGYPGTLVAFEMPVDAVQDYDSMIETIRERARERTPRRAIHKWLSFEAPPAGTFKFVVRSTGVEDAREAQRFSEDQLMPRLVKRQSVALDFVGIPTCTQSYVHALLYEALRLAWARKTPIYILNAQPAVKSTLELLENYALGG
ncbi:ATP-binding protein [Pyxidicoccus xibeiensis]|uniref:ATP-binding protein n=1 Tax=Pyxidicoccus xibeiensis TaxID=2906759 RepID=UPI0020A7D67C|nr:ATP-binding protein [Pyxidicoccus xibeiensis]MCP3143719.1 ATP-binding protein [Pyxidicoccus xibeiensis]